MSRNKQKNDTKDPYVGSIRRSFISIKSMLTLSLILYIFAVSIFIAVSFIHLHTNIIEYYVRSKAEFVSLTFNTSTIAQYLLNHEYDFLNENLRDITADKDILYSAILDSEGKVIAEYNNYIENLPDITDFNKGPFKKILFCPLKDSAGKNIGYDVYNHILIKNRQIGISRTIISSENIKEPLSRIKKILLTIIGVMALLEFILCLILFHITDKPIKELVNGAKKMTEGDFDIKLQDNSLTDTGLLGRYLNSLALTFRQYNDCINNQNNALKAIIDSMGSGLFTVDKDWRIQMFNKSAEQITGYKEKDVIGKTCQEVLRSEVCLDRCPLERALRETRPIVSEDFYIKTSKGSKVLISASTAPLKNESGEIIGGIKVFKDLTEINELKRQLFQADKMAALGQMISGIAHEINSPIGVINNNMNILLEYLASIRELIAKYRRALSMINDNNKGERDISEAVSDVMRYENSSHMENILEDLDNIIKENEEAYIRLSEIIKGLKNFAHIDMGKCEMADLNQALDFAIALIKFDKNVKIIKEYSHIPFIYCNVQQIEQVFTNLLLNAFQALNGKGEIRIRTQQKGNCILISIWDNGPGIPEDIILKIFDPYFTTKDIGVGTGLGLSISYKIITQHGGRIWANSEFGKWTEFFVEMPVKSPPSISNIWRD